MRSFKQKPMMSRSVWIDSIEEEGLQMISEIWTDITIDFTP